MLLYVKSTFNLSMQMCRQATQSVTVTHSLLSKSSDCSCIFLTCDYSNCWLIDRFFISDLKRNAINFIFSLHEFASSVAVKRLTWAVRNSNSSNEQLSKRFLMLNLVNFTQDRIKEQHELGRIQTSLFNTSTLPSVSGETRSLYTFYFLR